MKNPFSKKVPSQQEAFLRTYLDCIAPGIVKFEVDHYIAYGEGQSRQEKVSGLE